MGEERHKSNRLQHKNQKFSEHNNIIASSMYTSIQRQYLQQSMFAPRYINPGCALNYTLVLDGLTEETDSGGLLVGLA